MSLSTQTSNEAFSKLKGSGFLTKQEKAFISIVLAIGVPFTVNEVIEYAKTTEHEALAVFSNPVFMNKLPAGLMKQGVLRRTRTRICSVKNTNAVEWEVIEDAEIAPKERVLGYVDNLQALHSEVISYLIQGDRSALMAATDKISLFLRDKGKL